MTVKALAIVSPTDFHLLTVEAGQRLRGYINVHLTRDHKDIRLKLIMNGNYTTTWPSANPLVSYGTSTTSASSSGAASDNTAAPTTAADAAPSNPESIGSSSSIKDPQHYRYIPSGSESGDLVNYTTMAYDSLTKGCGGTLPTGYHRIPIDIDTTQLNGVDLSRLPPSFCYDATRGSDVEDRGLTPKLRQAKEGGKGEKDPAVAAKEEEYKAKRKYGQFQLRYTLKCIASWAPNSKLVGRKHKEATVEVLVMTPSTDRARLLAFPFPSLIGNIHAPGSPRPDLWVSPHRMIDTGLIRWSLTVPRRSVMAGDVLECVVGLGVPPGDRRVVDSVTVELRERATLDHKKFGLLALSGGAEGVLPSASPTRILAAVRETSWGAHNGARSGSHEPTIRNLPITIPWDAAPTMQDTKFFRSVVVVRLTIKVRVRADASSPDQSSDPVTCTKVEVPIHIVAPDIRLGKSFPPILNRDPAKERADAERLAKITDSEASDQEGNEESESAFGTSPSPTGQVAPLARKYSTSSSSQGSILSAGHASTTSNGGVRSGVIPGVAPDAVVGRFRVLYGYHARHEDELSARPGDIVLVSETNLAGWSHATTVLHADRRVSRGLNKATSPPPPSKQVSGLIPTHHLIYHPENPVPFMLGFHAATPAYAPHLLSTTESGVSTPPSRRLSTSSSDTHASSSSNPSSTRSTVGLSAYPIPAKRRPVYTTYDWRFLCRCEERYTLGIERLREHEGAYGWLVSEPEYALIPSPGRFGSTHASPSTSSPLGVAGRAPVTACARCRGAWMDEETLDVTEELIAR
ncbi:hypothetical protein DFS34DRAFT_598850 [Phlyctochytrium arcticum]|nr:hypothetical protein DFS34DRAFT_598850 [Phlyctochytrium arcticum]